MSRIHAGLAGFLLSAAHAFTAQGQERAPDEVIRHTRELVSSGRVKPALAVLKQAASRWPADEFVRTELATAYLADRNQFWALNVLRDFESSHPPACSARAWMVVIHIQQANLDLAEEVLDRQGCRALPQDRARERLLRSRIAELRADDQQARLELQQARRESSLYQEDSSLLQDSDKRLFPGRLPWGSWRIDMGLGWTSNGLAGSPVDRASLPDSPGSAVVSLDSRARFLWPEAGAVRPALEASFRTLQLAADKAHDLSYIAPGIRPGILLGAGYPRLLLAGSFDAVRLAAVDRYAQAPVWFAEGHRAEYELEATESLIAFGGAGRRFFREQGRTRWEVDQGLALGVRPGGPVRALIGASGRWNGAQNEAYDSMATSAIAQVQIGLPARLEGRVNGTWSYELFPRSKGYFRGAEDENRVDHLVRLKAGSWSPPWNGVRLGLDYEYAVRSSTADAYTYTDHRLLAHVVWTTDTDRIGTNTIGPAARTPLEHGGSGLTGVSDDLRIRDLMRQDEAVKQGSSCLK